MRINSHKRTPLLIYTIGLFSFIGSVLASITTIAQPSFTGNLPAGYTAYSGELKIGQSCTCATGGLTGAPLSGLASCGETLCYGSSSNTRYAWVSTKAAGINSTFCNGFPCFQLDGDDAVVIEGTISPIQNLNYYSFTFYQSFTNVPSSNKYTATQGSVNLGLNNLTLKRGADGHYVVVVTANTNTLRVIKNSLRQAGISNQIVNSYLIPASLTNVGTTNYPDKLSMLLRITPQSQAEIQQVNTFIQQTAPTTSVTFIKGSGINGNVSFDSLPKWENSLRANKDEYTAKLDQNLANLEISVINSYVKKGYKLKVRKKESLLHIDANQCRSIPINCQFDSPDAIYTGFKGNSPPNPVKPGDFNIQIGKNSDDVLMLLGVDHTLAGDKTLATYFSYESQVYPGSNDGTFSFLGLYTQGSARQYLNSAKSTNLYAIKIARQCGNDSFCTNVPYLGGATERTGFYIIGRVYLDKVTKTGPNPANLIPSRLLWFTKN